MLILLWAESVSSLADQETGALTLMSPRSLPSGAVAMLTLLEMRLVCSVEAPMLLSLGLAVPATMEKLVGSISQVPALPCAARVVTRVASPICT